MHDTEQAKVDIVGVIEWRLQVCMANAGVRFASELHRRLVELLGENDAPSEAQVSRLVRTRPERINLHTLAAFCVVLDCGVGDLLRYVPSPDPATRPLDAGRTEVSDHRTTLTAIGADGRTTS